MGKKSGFTSAEIEEIKRLYLQEGRSILQIPKILGKGSENSVRNALHKARVKHAPCLLYTSPSPRDGLLSRMPSSA